MSNCEAEDKIRTKQMQSIIKYGQSFFYVLCLFKVKNRGENMKFIELKKSLENKVYNTYYISGKDAFLRDSAQSMIEKRCVSTLPDFNKLVFNDENFNINKVLDAFNSLPVLDKYRVVVLSDVQPASKDITVLQNYLKNPNPTTCLIIKDGNNFNGFKTLLTLCEKIDCDFLEQKILQSIIVKKLADFEVKIDVSAIKTLIEYCNFDLTHIEGELPKLIAYSGKGGVISNDIVEKLVHKNVEYSIFELSNAVAEKNSAKAIQLLDLMLENKESPQNLLLLLVANFRRVFYVATTKQTDKELAKMLDVKEYAVKIARRSLHKFTQKKLKSILDLGGKLDFDIKNGKITDREAIYYFVSNILLF